MHGMQRRRRCVGSGLALAAACLLALTQCSIVQAADAGVVGAPGPAPPADALPPSPPEYWQALPKDSQLIFHLEIRGPYIVPFTSPKANVIARVLRDRYLRSAQLPDITVTALQTFTYLIYDSPSDSEGSSADPSPMRASGRRLGSRDLLQVEMSGAELEIVVTTNEERVLSEIDSVEEGVDSGSMAEDFTLAGIQTSNLTMLNAPYVEDFLNTTSTAAPTAAPPLS